MDPALLTSADFWACEDPWPMGDFPVALPEDVRLRGSVLFETSGSSGRPKWVVLGRDALLASAAAVNGHLGVGAGDVWGLSLPVHHVGGFGVCARAYQAGVGLAVFSGRWDAQAFSEWVAGAGVTHHSLVPTQVHDLVRAGCRGPSGLKAVVVGGGRLDGETGRAARELGWPVLASYGMTEACSQIATQRQADLTVSYQPAPIPLLPIWRVALEDGGLLRIAGHALFRGYLLIEAGCAVFCERAGDFHQTADRVALGEGGLTPLGRADVRVKVLGELVDPEEVERLLAEVSGGCLPPGRFAVHPVADARAEHCLVPLIEEGLPRGGVMEALAEYQARVPGYLRLQAPRFVGGIPRSPLGKVRRTELANVFAASVGE